MHVRGRLVCRGGLQPEESLLKILVLHGPNLNLLGLREPGVYGSDTLDDINAELDRTGKDMGIQITCRQSNLEGELVTWIQEAKGTFEGLVINPGGYTHTSVAIRDALLAVGLPTVEVHMSNPHARESFRHRSLIEDIVIGRVSGFHKNSYVLGLQGLITALRNQKN